jgi:hypothetical protein
MTSITPPSSSYNQNDLLLWALYLCGGSENWIDVEQMYLKAFELGPASLSWRTRMDIPDYKKCAKALQSLEDSKKSNRSTFIVKRDRYNRMLSKQGADWCRKYSKVLEGLYQGKPVFAKTSEHARQIQHVRSSDSFLAWNSAGFESLQLPQLRELFRCSPHTNRANWDKRLNALDAEARVISDHEIESFIQDINVLLDQEEIC